MRKLLLILFLFTLSSNALAKVETWECYKVIIKPEGYSYATPFFYKIDTTRPAVFSRWKGKWKILELLRIGPNEPGIFSYNKENNNIEINFPESTTTGILDLITKEVIWLEDGKISAQIACRVSE